MPQCFVEPAVPATFVIAADGRICFRQVGAGRWDTDEMVLFLERRSSIDIRH